MQAGEHSEMQILLSLFPVRYALKIMLLMEENHLYLLPYICTVCILLCNYCSLLYSD